MTNRRLFTALLLTAFTSTGCGLFFDPPPLDEPAQVQFEAAPNAAPAPTTRSASWDYSRSAETPLDAHVSEADLHGRMRVAPDRALLRMRATVPAASRAATVERAPQLAQAIARAIATEEGCAARIEEMTSARPISDERWQSTLLYTADISLEGLETVIDRHARIERCLGRIRAAIGPHDGVELRVSAPLLTVDDPSAHRATLLANAIESRTAIAREVERAPTAAGLTWTPARCHSTGAVTIGERTLGGVALSLDLSCQPDPGPAPARTAAAPEAAQAS